MSKEFTPEQFANGLRGKYIISQALCIAIRLLETVPFPHTEISNISDMKFLRDNLFNLYCPQEEAVRRSVDKLLLVKGGVANEAETNNDNIPG
jgi:hypothetical protein